MNRFFFPNLLIFVLVILPILLCLHLTYSFVSSSVPADPRTLVLASEWAGYTSASGITMIYPAGWLVKSIIPSNGLEEIVFVSRDGKEWIHSTLTEMTLDEYNWENLSDQLPSAAGYQALWPETIHIGDFEWTVFVWGQIVDGTLDGSPLLVMRTFSPEHGLKIWLGTDFPLNYQQNVEASGLIDVAIAQLAQFWNIASSIQNEHYGL